jgi:hypothetical protein
MVELHGGVDYVKECQQLEKALEIANRNYQYLNRVLAVLVAVGHVSQDKVEQAREIVSSLSS